MRVGCGSVSLCTQLVQAVTDADEEVMYAWRSFEAYPIISAVSGASSIQVPLLDHVHDLDAMAEQITGKTRLVFVCNPNNPTGTAVGREALLRFLRAVPSDVVVALDEAYREFVADPDVPDGLTLLDQFPNLIVLRTFSKAYGLAGLRVGYAIAADPALTSALRQTQVPFAVSTVAQAAALASLEPQAEKELLERVAGLVRERTRVRDALLGFGYEVPPSQANFVWLPLGDATTDWAAGCEERQVIVRALRRRRCPGHDRLGRRERPLPGGRRGAGAPAGLITRPAPGPVSDSRGGRSVATPNRPADGQRQDQDEERQQGAERGRHTVRRVPERLPTALQAADESGVRLAGLVRLGHRGLRRGLQRQRDDRPSRSAGPACVAAPPTIRGRLRGC